MYNNLRGTSLFETILTLEDIENRELTDEILSGESKEEFIKKMQERINKNTKIVFIGKNKN